MNCFFAFKHTDIQAANPHCRKNIQRTNPCKTWRICDPQVTGAASIQRGFCVCAQFPRLSGLARVSWASQEHSLPVVRADEAMDTSDIWQSGQRGGGLLWNRWRITLHWYIHDIHGCWFFRVYAYIYIIMLFQSMFVAGTLSTSLAMQFQQGFGTFQVIFKSDPAKKSEAPNHEGSFPTRSASGSSWWTGLAN